MNVFRGAEVRAFGTTVARYHRSLEFLRLDVGFAGMFLKLVFL